MKTFFELFLRASRALPFLFLLLVFYDQSLRAQVPLPEVKFQDYRSQDVSPLLSEASNASTQSAYESIVDEKIRQVSQSWQQDAYQKIQNALLSITDSDTFNDVNAYRAHVEALLVAQKEEAWNGYWAALQNEVAQNRQTFAAALANRTLVSTQASQTSDAKAALSISSNPANAWDTARSALDASHAKWQKEYLAKLENGMRDYEAALRGVTNAEANYNQGIAQTDEEFRTRLAEIQAAENRVRAGVSSQVDGMEASLASSDFFYEENCDAQTNVCTADRSKPTAAALELRSLIDSMRKNIADGAPLSEIGHQMRDYLAAQKASADQHVQHWQSLSYGQLPFSMSANQAPRSAEEWAAWAGRPYTQGNPCTDSGLCAGVPIALALMQLGDKFDGTYARGEAGYMLSQSDFKSFADFAANGSNADGVKAYIQSHGENRQVTDVLNANIIGLTTNQSYKQLGIQALTVARAPDPMLCVWMGMGNPLLAIGCALLLKDQSPETAFSLTATYKWQDNNAISNASVWSGYSSELAMGQESWDNMLLPALDTWEANTAAYKAKYDQWKIDSAAEAPLMAKKFSDARSTLLADERSYVNQMDQLWTSGEHDWANMYAQVKQAEANAGWYTDRITLSPVHGTQSPAQIAQESADASKLLKDLLANRPAIGTPSVSAQSSLESAYHNYLEGGSSLVGASSSGAPDVRLMDYIGSAMSQSLSGAQNVAFQNQADANAATERQKVIDSLRSAAESSFVTLDYSIPKDNKKKDATVTPPTNNGFTTEMLNGDTIRATRKIATGRALLKPGADPTKAESYTTEMTDQVLYLAPPESVKLSATQSLFSQWNQDDFLAENAKNEDEFNDGVQNLFAKAGESLNAANYLASERAAAFRNDASTQASNAATVKSLMVSLLTGGTFGDFMMQSMKGQIATQLEAVTGIPAGMWSAFSGGGTFKQCMGNYMEGLAWQNFETATGLEGLSSIFQSQMKKAEANKKRREAAQLKPEDYIGGGFTYVWRNAEYRPGLKRTLGVAETVVFTTLEVVSTIIPAIGNAVAAGVIAGYYATKQAYVGSLHGGTKGAVAGAASGAVNGLIAAELEGSSISPSIDIAYDSETGWSGSVGLQAGEGVKVGGSVTMHEGHGMTGFNVNAGIGISKAATIGANASFDGTGKYQGSQLALNLQNKSGRTFTAGVNFGKAGYSGVTLGTSQSIGDGPAKLSNSQSITLNKDGSKDISASVNASITDRTRAGLNQFGAGANTSFHIDKKTGITVNQKLNTQLGFQSAKDAAAYLEKLKAQGSTPAERKAQQQRDSDQNKRNQNESKDVLAGSARRKEEEEADSANSAAPSGKGFLDTIGDALGDFGQSVKNLVMYGDFSSDKTKLTEMMTKVTAGIVPGMKPEEIREKFWENFSNLSDAEKAFSGSMSSMSDDQKKRTIMTTLNPGVQTGEGSMQGYAALYYLTAAGTQSGLYSYGAESAKVFNQMMDSIQSISTDGTITPTQMKWVAQQYGIDLDTVDTARATREASALLGKDLNDQRMEELQRAAQERLAELDPIRTSSAGETFKYKSVEYQFGVGIVPYLGRSTVTNQVGQSYTQWQVGVGFGAGVGLGGTYGTVSGLPEGVTIQNFFQTSKADLGFSVLGIGYEAKFFANSGAVGHGFSLPLNPKEIWNIPNVLRSGLEAEHFSVLAKPDWLPASQFTSGYEEQLLIHDMQQLFQDGLNAIMPGP